MGQGPLRPEPDRLAERYGFSASGLAKKAGLDPTSFNRSKRLGPDGRPRWPSTESIAKILHVTGASVEEYIALLDAKGVACVPGSGAALIDAAAESAETA